MSELHPSADDFVDVPRPRASRRVVSAWIVGVLVIVVIASGVWAWFCLPDVMGREAPEVDRNSPEAVAGAYYERLGSGHAKDAEALLWRPERFEGMVRDHSLRGMRDVRVGESWEDTAAYRPSEYLALERIRELEVRYTTVTRDGVGNPPGEQMRFVLLGRETADGPWFVLETGTGP